MSKVAIKGNASGTATYTLEAPAGSTDRTLTLPDEAGTVLTNSGYITADGTNLILKADGTNEDARIDSSGNLLVGNTTGASTANGHSFFANGIAYHVVDGNICLRLNRKTSDGNIVEFRKDNTTVGSIGSVVGQYIQINTGGSTGYLAVGGVREYAWDAIRIYPNTDNTNDLGLLSKRFDDIYATNGTIQTSDRNEKQDIEELSEAEQRVAVAAKSLLRKFRWKSAVEEKGDDARIHFGIIAQDLQAAFEAEGLDAGRYAMFISSTWWETEETYTDDDGVEQTRTNTYDTADEAPEGATERTRLGVRYPELLAFIIAAI